jgi:DNA invertase Pin-like site-specific DNA recombinase
MTMALVGYTRANPASKGDKQAAHDKASAEDELASRCEALRAAGCTEIIHEYADRNRRYRPKLAVAISHLRPGDTLMVTDLDCVAWSLLQLTELLASLRARGIMFRSIESPIDTSGLQGSPSS